MRYAALPLVTLLCACATKPPTPPAVQVQTVTKVVEVQRPCPVTVPRRPEPLPQPLPTDLFKLATLLGAKLAEWAGPGMYGDRADAALQACVKP